MNLLVSCGSYHPHCGGAETLTADLCERLARDGHRIRVVTRQQPGAPPTEEHRGTIIERLDYPLPYHAFRARPGLARRSFLALRRLHAILATENVDVVCVGLFDMSVAYLLALRLLHRFRLVIYLHGGETRSLSREASFRRLLRSALRRADGVVAVSRGLADDVSALIPEVRAKLIQIPNGIDVAAVEAQAPAARRQRYLLYAGRLHEDKNVALLLRAFAEAAPDVPDVMLVLAGTGELEAPLKALAEELGLRGRVGFLGGRTRAEVFSLMHGAEALLLGSAAEGMPLVALEGFAAGLPLIAPRAPGVAEIVEHGVNGYLAEGFAPGALAEGMRRVCGDAELRARLGAAARRSALSYDLSRTYPAHVQAITGR